MWNVIDRLFIATEADASDLSVLRSAGISHIVNCAAEIPDYYPDQFTYLRLDLKDPDRFLASKISNACEFMEAGRQVGNTVVHCQGAISRSPAIVLSYLCHRGQSIQDAAHQLAAVLPTRPNDVFLQQITRHFGCASDGETLSSIIEVLSRQSNRGCEPESP